MWFRKMMFYPLLMLSLLCLISSGKAKDDPPSAIPVTVSKVLEKTARSPLTLIGKVQPFRRSLVASEIEGMVTQFPWRERDFVAAQKVVVELEKKVLELEIQGVEASIKEVEIRLEWIQKKITRLQKLYAQKAISLEDLEDQEYEKKILGSREAVLKANLAKMKYDLSKTKIESPFNGYVIKTHTEIGQWLSKGSPIVEIVDLEKVEVLVYIPEQHIEKIQPKDYYYLTFEGISNRFFTGTVLSMIPETQRSGSFPVKIQLDNSKSLIKSGMNARVTFWIGPVETMKLVDKDALVENNFMQFVYVVRDGISFSEKVNVKAYYKNFALVEGNLKKGDLVVIRGNERLRPGQAVQPTFNPSEQENEK